MDYGLGQYTLDANGEPVPCEDLHTWARWMEGRARHVADEIVCGLRVSTVFLGLNHNFHGGRPILWETMIFGPAGPSDETVPEELRGYQERYTSRAQALAGHAAAVALVKRRFM